MTDLFASLSFSSGAVMTNRFMLAPLTNQQSHADGTLSEEEERWLGLRAQGGFGAVMTAAAFVNPEGRGFDGQLGVHDDICLPGLIRAADTIRAANSLSLLQLHHGGARAAMSTGLPRVAPSEDPEFGAVAMTQGQVEAMIEDFISAAERAERAGFDGVELHGAHTYLLCAFLSAQMNQRTDCFGGSLDNRAKPIRAIIDGVRKRCGPQFTLGLRLSGERMGLQMADVLTLSEQLMQEGGLDFLDLSLWDVFKDPVEAAYQGKPLIAWFAELDRAKTRLGVAGQVRSGATAQACLDAGADFVLIGRAAIANHDFPRRVREAADYGMPTLPLSRAHLLEQAVSPTFLAYLEADFPGFVEGE
ncbi:NADH:flavin oxidoreductase [Sphingobium tyrosinilyticum]|uniref:NADH:flavin oxidoreductase n=1 Tax=Sphingobium tyrosinilyticum TaxID=2715436 RepID=A0ABV9F6Q0_9SPHN